MSMYGMVFGDRSGAYGAIPALLGPIDVGRYRDVWIEADTEDSVVLAVYTRNGGGNREAYAEQIATMQAHELFLSDEDDSFDSTYATFRFRIPRAVLAEQLEPDEVDRVLGNASPRRDMADVWREALKQIGKRP